MENRPNVYIKVTVLIMACCNSIYLFQGLILRLHDVPNLAMMCLIMYFCVCGAIVETTNVNKNCVFYSANGRFLHFTIL